MYSICIHVKTKKVTPGIFHDIPLLVHYAGSFVIIIIIILVNALCVDLSVGGIVLHFTMILLICRV